MSSDKSAIERLRALLDERGVKHVGNGGMVRWTSENGCVCRAFTRPGHLTVDVAIMDASPEQAISATLGAGECTLESAHAYCDPYVRTAYQIELSCHTLDAWDDPVPPSYCPYCGKRVVKEDA